MPAIEERPAVSNYMPFIISDGTNSLNLNDHGLLSTIENADDQYTFIQDPEYLSLVKQNSIEIADVKFKITDVVWDFKEKAPEIRRGKNSTYYYEFNDLYQVSDCYQALIKLFVLNNLIHYGIHRPMVKKDYLNAKRFVIYVYNHHIYSLSDISIKTISDFLNETDITETSKQHIRISINKFLLFYYQITGSPVDESLTEYLQTNNMQVLNAEHINGKLGLLPQSFMKELVNLLLDTLENKAEDADSRIKAGILLIATQTGLRPNELTIIPYDCIVNKTVDGIPYTELHYLTTKGVFGSSYEEARTFANETTIKAVNTIRKLKVSKYLGDVTYEKLYKFFQSLVCEHASELGCLSAEPLDGFDAKPIQVTMRTDGSTMYVSMPKMKQFRVYLASELRRRGYNDFSIASLLSHKGEQMLGYYARPIAKSEEDKIYRDMFLKDVIEDDLKIIGTRGDEYTARINTFMENHKELDVRSSLREIADDIDGLMPMKVIPGGFCICLAPKMSCEAMNKENADSIYCAYGLCSNQSHLYFDMPFHLSQLRNCEEAVIYNTKNGYVQEAEKELYKAQFICKSLLKPEIDELKELMKRKGSDYIIQKHPEMKPIIDNLENTEKEIKTWETATI